MTNPSPNPTPNSARPLLIVGGVTVLVAVILLLLPPEIQQFLFAVIILAGLCVVVIQITPTVLGLMWQVVTSVRGHSKQTMLAGSLLLMYIASFYYLPDFKDTFYGFYLYLFAVLLLYPAREMLPDYDVPAKLDRPTDEPAFRPKTLIVVAISLILLLMINMPKEIMPPVHVLLGMKESPTWLQMGLLGIIIGGLAHTFGARLLPRRFQWKRHHTLLLLIVLLGGAVRAWDIENTYRLFVDEFSFVGDVYYIMYDNPVMLIPDSAPNTDVYSFFQAILSSIFGPSLTSLRLVSAAVSIGGLVVVYAFARQLFSLRVALMSALLFATLPVYIQFGRIGLNNVVDPVFGMLGFVYVLRGMRSRRMSDYALAGLAFGLTHYFYEGGRLFFTLFLLCWLVWIHIFARRDSMFRSPTLRHWGALFFCLIVLMIPVYHTFWQFRFPVTQRLDAMRTSEPVVQARISEFLLDTELGHLGTPVHQYVFFEAYDNFYQSEYAFILPILVPFFLLGFGRLLWQIRTVRGSLIIWWIVGASVSNNLITKTLSAHSPRHIVVYGVLMIVVALGIHTVWTLLSERATGRFRRWVSRGFIGYLLVVSGVHIHHYFDHVVPNMYDRMYERNLANMGAQPALDDMILRAIELPSDTTVISISDWLFPVTHEKIAPYYYGRKDDLTVKGMFFDDVDGAYFASLPRDTDYVFTFTRFYQDALMPMIKEEFVITKIETSTYNIPIDNEMLMVHAPLSAQVSTD